MGEGPEASVSHSVLSSASIVSHVVGNQQYVFQLRSWTYRGVPFCPSGIPRIGSELSMHSLTWEAVELTWRYRR